MNAEENTSYDAVDLAREEYIDALQHYEDVKAYIKKSHELPDLYCFYESKDQLYQDLHNNILMARREYIQALALRFRQFILSKVIELK